MKKTFRNEYLFAMVIALMIVIASALLSVSYASSGSALIPEDAALPYAIDNTIGSLRRQVSLVPLSDGYMRVVYDHTNEGKEIHVEYYDKSFSFLKRGYMPMELESWGGFYAGSDAYYIVEGKANIAENNNAEVIRVIKYDKSWNRLGAASITSNTDIFGGKVRNPFSAGSCEMCELNGTLYIATGHLGYLDPELGVCHQGLLVIAVNEKNMTGSIVDADLWHSFAQYVAADRDKLYLLENSEGDYCASLKSYNTDSVREASVHLLEYGGERSSARAIEVYASTDDIQTSGDNILCVGTSIDQSLYDSVTDDTAHNVYISVTPVSDLTKESTSIKWLTGYSGNGKAFFGLNLTKINDNRFMVSWEETTDDDNYPLKDHSDMLSGGKLHYLFVDGSGNVISSEYTADATLSDCEPVISGNTVSFCSSLGNTVDFYTIDAVSGAFSKTVYRVAGDDITWNLNGDTLSLTGKGKIRIDGNEENSFRYPTSTTKHVFSSSGGLWSPLSPTVKKIKIGNGIVSISDHAFENLNNAESIELPKGLTEIGAMAFYGCEALKKIYIPASVEKIGEDFLWTGMYYTNTYLKTDSDHVVRAVIYGDCGSYAIKYADENHIASMQVHPGITRKIMKTSWAYENYWNCPSCGRNYYDSDGEVEIYGKGIDFDIVNVYQVDKQYYKVLSAKKKTAAFLQARNGKSVTVPATVKIGEKVYKVIQINSGAFKDPDIKTITIGKNVKIIKKNALKESNATKLILKTKLLKKSKVKGSLNGSKVKTIKVKTGSRKTNKKLVKTYRKYFTKANAGRKAVVA